MRMTKTRKEVLEKMNSCALYFGYTDGGSEEYYYSDGSAPNQEVVSGLLSAGALKKSESELGMGQEIILA